jgi:hypothetical protein
MAPAAIAPTAQVFTGLAMNINFNTRNNLHLITFEVPGALSVARFPASTQLLQEVLRHRPDMFEQGGTTLHVHWPFLASLSHTERKAAQVAAGVVGMERAGASDLRSTEAIAAALRELP